MAGPQGGHWRARRRLTTIGLPLLIVLVGGVAALLVARSQATRAEMRLTARAADTTAAIRGRMAAYTDVLYGVRGLFEASGSVSRREFHEYMSSVELTSRYPGVQVLGVAELVPTDHTQDLVASVRRDARRSHLGYPRFAISGPAAIERRLVIDYLEPVRGNEAAFGLDFFAEPNRRRAAERALTDGVAAATAPVRLVQDPRAARGFLVYLGIRRGDVVGTAYAAFRTANLMHGILGAVRGAHLQLEDVGPGPGAPVQERAKTVAIYTTGGPQPQHGAVAQHFDLLGRRWALRYAPTAPVLPRAERLLPWALLAAGLALAALAARLLSAAARTERRALALATRMTADLRAKEAELERSNEELARFAYVASHDLREPLRSVTGFIGLLSRRHGSELGEDARTWIGYAMEGAERMNGLIGDLLEYSRAGHSRVDAAADADLAVSFERATGNLAAAIEECDAAVTAGALPAVAADQREMDQVMQNLLANAIKYRGERRPDVHVEAERTDAGWAVSVQDNGIGIDPAHQDEVFDLFQRLRQSGDNEGTGMGLSICKKIVEARGGRIVLESTPGEGSRFTVELPAALREVVA
jgi:signal transduction histidine kinase